MTGVRNLDETRGKIDEIDGQMLKLFCERMKLAADVAAYKEQHGIPTLRPEREQEILERAAAEAGPEFADYAEKFFVGIMKLSREYQNALRHKEDSE